MPEDDLKHYTATTLPNGPKQGCELYLRRCKAFGGIATQKEDEVGLCDVLDDDGDVVENFPLNKKGIRYLIKALNAKVEPQ